MINRYLRFPVRQWRSHWIWLKKFCNVILGSSTLSLCFVSKTAQQSQFEDDNCVSDSFSHFIFLLWNLLLRRLSLIRVDFWADVWVVCCRIFTIKARCIRFHEEGSWWQVSTRRIAGLQFHSDQSKWSAAGKSFRPLILNLLAVLFHFWSFHHSWKERWTGRYLSPRETNEGFCVRVATLCGIEGHGCPPPSHVEHILCLLALNVLCCDCAWPPLVIDYWWPAGCLKKKGRWMTLSGKTK